MSDRNGAAPADPGRDPSPAPVGGVAGKGEALLSVKGLEKHFPITKGVLRRKVGAVRAVDGTDATQTAATADPHPDGASGYHRVFVDVAG